MTVRRNRVAMLAGVALVLVAALVPGAARSAPATQLGFLGQQIIPTATQFQGTQFGGLSGIDYDARRNVFYAFSDDPVNVRFYTLRIAVSTGVPVVEIVAVTTLRDASGNRASADRRSGRPWLRTTRSFTSEGFASRRSTRGARVRSRGPVAPSLPFRPVSACSRRNARRAAESRLRGAATPPTDASSSPAPKVRSRRTAAGDPRAAARATAALQLRPDARPAVLYWTDPIARLPGPVRRQRPRQLLALNNEFLLSWNGRSHGCTGTGNRSSSTASPFQGPTA